MSSKKEERGVATEGLLLGLEPAECWKGSYALRKEDHCCPEQVPAIGGGECRQNPICETQFRNAVRIAWRLQQMQLVIKRPLIMP